jgi:hypothetical protein
MIKVWREGANIKVQCEECSLFLCPMDEPDGKTWRARHPHPDDCDGHPDWDHLRAFYGKCPNKGKEVTGTI